MSVWVCVDVWMWMCVGAWVGAWVGAERNGIRFIGEPRIAQMLRSSNCKCASEYSAAGGCGECVLRVEKKGKKGGRMGKGTKRKKKKGKKKKETQTHDRGRRTERRSGREMGARRHVGW